MWWNYTVRTLDDATVRDLIITYSVSEMATKLVGYLGTAYSFYSEAFSCSAEVWHNWFKAGNQAILMCIQLLHLKDHLPSDTHTRANPATEERF